MSCVCISREVEFELMYVVVIIEVLFTLVLNAFDQLLLFYQHTHSNLSVKPHSPSLSQSRLYHYPLYSFKMVLEPHKNRTSTAKGKPGLHKFNFKPKNHLMIPWLESLKRNNIGKYFGCYYFHRKGHMEKNCRYRLREYTGGHWWGKWNKIWYMNLSFKQHITGNKDLFSSSSNPLGLRHVHENGHGVH